MPVTLWTRHPPIKTNIRKLFALPYSLHSNSINDRYNRSVQTINVGDQRSRLLVLLIALLLDELLLQLLLLTLINLLLTLLLTLLLAILLTLMLMLIMYSNNALQGHMLINALSMVIISQHISNNGVHIRRLLPHQHYSMRTMPKQTMRTISNLIIRNIISQILHINSHSRHHSLIQRRTYNNRRHILINTNLNRNLTVIIRLHNQHFTTELRSALIRHMKRNLHSIQISNLVTIHKQRFRLTTTTINRLNSNSQDTFRTINTRNNMRINRNRQQHLRHASNR